MQVKKAILPLCVSAKARMVTHAYKCAAETDVSEYWFVSKIAFWHMYQELTHWPLGDVTTILKSVIFNLFIQNSSSGIRRAVARRRILENPTNEKSALVQVMAWCRQATSHYLDQYWPRSMSPHGVPDHKMLNLMISPFTCLVDLSTFVVP